MNNYISVVELNELEYLEKAATPGPWQAELGITHTNSIAIMYNCKDSAWLEIWAPQRINFEANTYNAELILASRNAMPRLLAEVRRLRALVDDSENYWKL